MDKFRVVDGDFSACDGVDILLSTGRTQVETRNEIKSLYEFLRNMNMLEIRYTLGAYTRPREELINMLKGMKDFPPRWIRLDQHLQKPNITVGHHKGMAEMIKEYMPTPLKISGNVDLETVKEFRSTKARFDVSMAQAISIVKEFDKEMVEKQEAARKQLELAKDAD